MVMRRGTLSVVLSTALLLAGTPHTPAPAEARIRPVATGLAFPVNMAFAPDGRLFFNEKDTGRIRIIENGKLLPKPFAKLPVMSASENGLLGLALDPLFPARPWVYVYYSDATDGRNRLIRIRADGNRGTKRRTLLDALPVAGLHNGGDIAFGLDGKLYVVIGEGGRPRRAQDPNSLGGKVLRLNPDGGVPSDNPFGPASPVFSLGHRNSFGLCVDPATDDLWETENGPDRDDEVNRIVAGGNYGWPTQLGPGGAGAGFVDPVLVFPHVIVPTGCAFLGGALFFGDFGGNLHEVRLAPPDDRTVLDVRTVASLGAGITDVTASTDGALYVSTQDAIYRVDEPRAHPSRYAPPAGGTTDPWPVAVPVGAAVLATLVALAVRLRGRTARP